MRKVIFLVCVSLDKSCNLTNIMFLEIGLGTSQIYCVCRGTKEAKKNARYFGILFSLIDHS